MPALPAVPGLAKFVVVGHQGSVQWANVFHIQKTGVWSDADLAAMATKVRTSYAARFGPSLSTSGGIDWVDSVDLSTDTGAVGHDATTAAFTGSAACTSPQVAYVLHWNIPRRYRGGHPRTYLPCVAEADVDASGTVSSGTKANLGVAATGFINDIAGQAVTGGPAALFCVHYRRDNAPLGFPLLDIILSGSCRSTVGTQRRRLPPIRA